VNPFVAAAVQVAPRPGPLDAAAVAANTAHALDWVERCVDATGAQLVVVPEAVTTGFGPGLPPEELWDLIGPIPGPCTEAAQALAARLRTILVWPTYERGPERGVVFNSSAVIGADGGIQGVYRKTHLFPGERAWVTEGDDVCVVDTALARLGTVICFDGDFPELARMQAVQGAEVLVRPSAFLRAADIWELTTRARAYDNHTYVVAANAVGQDPAGFLYFGNSLIVGPTAEVLARATTQEQWVVATIGVDPMRSISPGSSVRQGFDHLIERNLPLYRRHRALLEGEAHGAFPPGGPVGATSAPREDRP
jgi:deaminated glutathione amidase